MPQGDPKAGEKYLHFKNKLYQIIAIAQHSETGERLVVYQALYGTFQIYARPLSMFVSPVDKEKYPDVKQKYRFQWVEFKKTGQEPAKSKAGVSKQQVSRTEPVKPESSEVKNVKTETAKPEFSEVKNVKTEAAKPEFSDMKNVKTEAAKPESSDIESAKPEVPKTESVKKDMSVEDKMLAFFDADTAQERYEILVDMRGEVTDRMINNMAVVLDVVIEEGPLDLRYEELKGCLRTRQRYERSRWR